MPVKQYLKLLLLVVIASAAMFYLGGRYFVQRQLGSPEQRIALAREAMIGGYEKGALELFRPLAENGDRQAQYWLGHMYNIGLGVEKDPTKAIGWIQKAAEQGFVPAEFRLGQMYRDGVGTLQDFGQALKWFKRAASSGDPIAERSVGELYERGWGVSKNLVSAYAWYSLAAAAEDPLAVHLRQDVLDRINGEQIAEGEKQAEELKATFGAPKPAGGKDASDRKPN
jgi:TPR repeat protein